jgi:hypothetical protein
MLDKQSLQLKGYTKMFTFQKEKVEYSLGMDMIDDDIVFGYSIMDRDTRYMSMNRSWFDENRV